MVDPLKKLTDAGVSLWLDDLSRVRLAEGGLAGLVRDRHVSGVTTNPTFLRQGDHRQRRLCRSDRAVGGTSGRRRYRAAGIDRLRRPLGG